eukprot:8660504-Pyramimonas_sp.AAC.1
MLKAYEDANKTFNKHAYRMKMHRLEVGAKSLQEAQKKMKKGLLNRVVNKFRGSTKRKHEAEEEEEVRSEP